MTLGFDSPQQKFANDDGHSRWSIYGNNSIQKIKNKETTPTHWHAWKCIRHMIGTGVERLKEIDAADLKLITCLCLRVFPKEMQCHNAISVRDVNHKRLWCRAAMSKPKTFFFSAGSLVHWLWQCQIANNLRLRFSVHYGQWTKTPFAKKHRSCIPDFLLLTGEEWQRWWSNSHHRALEWREEPVIPSSVFWSSLA